MPSYFKPLRRKIGVVTLGLACVFAAIWVRSPVTFDGFYTPTAQLVSSNGGMFCEILALPFEFTFDYGSLGPKVQKRPNFYNDPNGRWRWRCCGFAYRSEKVELIGPRAGQKVTDVSFIVPYWSIVIPLTLLSAWLLFSKPRAKKPSETMVSPE